MDTTSAPTLPQMLRNLEREGVPMSPAANLDRHPILVEREKTHGSFVRTAHIAQELKRLFRRELSQAKIMDNRHAEALDMIAVKLARIMSGDINEKDHWKDIGGYAKLGEEACG